MNINNTRLRQPSYYFESIQQTLAHNVSFSATRTQPKGPVKKRKKTTLTSHRSIPNNTFESTLGTYLREINATPLLNAAEEMSLASRVQEKDAQARSHFIKANLRLVVNIARQFQNRGLALLDLIQEGNLGLFKAIDKYNPKKFKTRFSTYSSYWIKQSIQRAIGDQKATVKMPIYLQQAAREIYKVRQKYALDKRREPTTEELAEEVILAKQIASYQNKHHVEPPADIITKWRTRALKKIKSWLANIQMAPRPLQEAAHENNDGSEPLSLKETVVAKDSVSSEDKLEKLKDRLTSLLQTLDETERMVITYRFGLNNERIKTLNEIGETLGLTRERVRQIEAEALWNLRDPKVEAGLEDFLPDDALHCDEPGVKKTKKRRKAA